MILKKTNYDIKMYEQDLIYYTKRIILEQDKK